MELTVEHLAPYLPHNLELDYIVRDKVVSTGIMNSITHNDFETHPTKVSIDFKDSEHIWMFRPKLIPMQKLLEDKWYHIWRQEIDTESLEVLVEEPYDAEFFQSCKFSYVTTKELFKNHFDIFGLIGAGLADEK